VCGERSGAIWLPAHHQSGCCILVVGEEIPPPPLLYVKRFECLEKGYINVTNYYYYSLDRKYILKRYISYKRKAKKMKAFY